MLDLPYGVIDGAVLGAPDDDGFGLVLFVLHPASDTTIVASNADAIAAVFVSLERSMTVSLAKCMLTLPHS